MAPFDAPAALLTAIVASADDAIVSKDLNGYVTSWNPAAEQLFGFTAAEMIGQHITRIIPADRLAEEDYVLSQVRAGHAVDHFETVRQRKNGSLVELSITVSPVRDDDGRIIGASKIARDITERKRMERDAMRLAAIVESSEDAIAAKDLNGIVQSWNQGAERIFGYSAEEMIGRSITTIIPEERAGEEEAVLARIRAGQRIEHFETVRRRKDGSLIDVSLSVSPIRTPAGKIVGASKIARDITEQKQLQQAVEQASRAKDDFLAMLSHELRTPLNTVIGYTRMLQSGSVAPKDLPKTLEAIRRNADALTRLVSEVLDTSRIVTGKIQLNLQECDVGAVVEEAVATIEPTARAKSIHIISKISRPLMVHADADRLRQVLWNLLTNAVKFTDEEGTLTLSAMQETRRNIRISVEDNGIGIAPESLPHVFRRFYQADQTHSRAHTGLGLGLALARDFVELHGGRIEAHSEGLGHGARFDVILPAAEVAVAADA